MATNGQLVRECQSAHDISSVVNIFAPARLDANAQKATSRTEVDDHVEVFEHATDSQLREIFTDRGGLSTWEHRPPFEGGYFAVLDDRSVRDETLEIHAKHTEFVGEYADDDIDYGTEVAAEYWLKWRVSISECKVITFFTTDELSAKQDAVLHVSISPSMGRC